MASALNYIDLSNNEKSPRLTPYPSWEANFLPNKSDSSIVSPFRVKADECDRLWVMDGGFDSLLGPVKIVKPNAIAIYDLRSDQLIRRFEIPSENLIRKSLLTNIVSILCYLLDSLYVHFSRFDFQKMRHIRD